MHDVTEPPPTTGRTRAPDRRDFQIALCGVLMGAADIVPGVSGGTVALVLGVYQRLVTAISRFDRAMVGMVAQRRVRDAAAYIDLRFLGALAAGIVLGAGSLAHLMHYLLEHHRTHILAVFFGLILASSYLVGRIVPSWKATEIAMLLAGFAGAFWLMGRMPTTAPLSYAYLFLSATVAICAMILPGISGAFVLLILGMYYHVTGVIKEVVSGQVTLEHVLFLAVFGSGCAVGLITFSKALKWLLQYFPSVTIAALCGFMLGSLRRIWPFKVPLPAAPGTSWRDRQFENVWPSLGDAGAYMPLVLMLAALVLVLVLHHFSARRRPSGNPHFPA